MRVEADAGAGACTGAGGGGFLIAGLDDDGCAVAAVLHDVVQRDARGCDKEKAIWVHDENSGVQGEKHKTRELTS